MEKIPCTVGILSFNSAGTIRRSLESVRDFEEIIVVDGGSTDETLAIASEFGARVIAQDQAYKNEEGKVVDFAGVRNQYLDASRFDWIFALDSDEYITPGLAEDIRGAIHTDRAAYWVLRKYEFEGVVIERAINYPSKQMRFFHKRAVSRYIKPIHERIEVLPGAIVGQLDAYMVVPVTDDFEETKRKWTRYIELEKARRTDRTFRKWFKGSARECAVMVLYTARLARLLLLQRGTRFPLRMEMRIFWYQWKLVSTLFFVIRRF